MAIKNADMIFSAQASLYDAGLIELDEDGMFEPLYTYQVWKAKGFQVKRGEHAIVTLPLWHRKSKAQLEKEKEEGKEYNPFVPKRTSLFIRRQVEPIMEMEGEH